MTDQKTKAAADPPLDCLVGLPERLRAYVNDNGDWAAGLLPSDVLMAAIEIERLRVGLRELRDVVIDHNRSGTDWKTPELFGRMMGALAKADTLLVSNA